ncbi:heavy-metal-associated domain-containing protein [uncultured Dysosmobacter sp.]|uniref:heavy-metal-associated domain-containing protein n=1 Tax=uncultured Dysosmobacter sp. TaxID=2591384 RepID=UPI00262BF1E4|nr:heavy-metal-associated domain-containing protein [uncultured Dysosmobacter sp.]
MAHISAYFSLENAGDQHDVHRLKRELDTLPGVTSVSVNGQGCLAVDYDSTGIRQADIQRKVQELGYHLRDVE